MLLLHSEKALASIQGRVGFGWMLQFFSGELEKLNWESELMTWWTDDLSIAIIRLLHYDPLWACASLLQMDT